MNTNVKYQAKYWLAIFYDNLIAHNGIYVLGYTKTGTNWMRNLIRHYYEIDQLELPNKDHSFFRQRVHHMHRFLPFNYYKKKVVYLSRDGRDAMVSRYFTLFNQSTQRYTKDDFAKFLGKTPDVKNIREELPHFITFLKTHHKSSIDYKSHVNKAFENDFFIVKYEELHSKTKETLIHVIKHLTPNATVDDQKVDEVLNYCSFESAKKRQKKTKKNMGFLREGGGKKGNWREYFSYESARIFCEYSNDILIKLGYEKDDKWIEDFK